MVLLLLRSSISPALSLDEMREALVVIGVDEDKIEEVFEHLVKEIDQDGDGSIDAEEFIAMLTREDYEDEKMAYLQHVFTEVLENSRGVEISSRVGD